MTAQSRAAGAIAARQLLIGAALVIVLVGGVLIGRLAWQNDAAPTTGSSVGGSTVPADATTTEPVRVSQTGTATTTESVGAPVIVAVTDPEQRLVVPDVALLPERDAVDVLERAGFAIGDRTEVVAPQPAGTVVGQDPIAGTPAAMGTSVAIRVSLGSGVPVGLFAVPDVRCLKLGQATERLGNSGWKVGNVTYSFSGGPVDDTWLVESQSPVEGSLETTPSEVDLLFGSPFVVCS